MLLIFIYRRSLRPLPSITFIGFFKTMRVNVVRLRMKLRIVIVMMSPQTLCVWKYVSKDEAPQRVMSFHIILITTALSKHFHSTYCEKAHRNLEAWGKLPRSTSRHPSQ